MPFIDKNTGQTLEYQQPTNTMVESIDPVTNKEVTVWDYTNAFVRKESPWLNPILDYVDRTETPDYIDPNFDPLAELESKRPDLFDDYSMAFSDVKNRAEFARKTFRIDWEKEQEETMAQADTTTKVLGTLTGAVADPLNLIPIAAGIKAATKAGRAVQGVVAGSVTAGAISMTREATLQATQLTRTEEESIRNVVVETALGGILGGLAGALTKPLRKAAAVELDSILNDTEFKFKFDENTGKLVLDDSTRISELHKEGYAGLNESLVKGTSGFDAITAPEVRAATSKFLTIRKFGDKLYVTNMIKNKHQMGQASPTKIAGMADRRHQQVNAELNEIWGQWKQFKKELGPEAGTFDDFSKRVFRQMDDPNYVDGNAFVGRAASIMRDGFENLFREMKEAGVLDDSVQEITDYFPHIWDVDKLNESADLELMVRDKLSDYFQNYDKKGVLREVPIEKVEGDRIADEALESIRGQDSTQLGIGRIAESVISSGKFGKERSILMPGHQVMDALITDPFVAYKQHMMRGINLVETQKGLKELGFENLTQMKTAIRDEGEQLIKNAPAKERGKIRQEVKEAQEFVENMYRSAVGQIRRPAKADKILSAVMDSQFMRLMGNVTLSSVGDIMLIPFRQGFFNTFRDGFMPMIRSIKSFKGSSDQLYDIIGFMEHEKASVMHALSGRGEIDDLITGNSLMDKYFMKPLQGVKSYYARATGLPYWNEAGRRFSAVTSANKIVRQLKNVQKTGKISQEARTALAQAGIGEADYKMLLKQVNKYVTEHDGSYYINPSLWRDKKALAKLNDAIQMDVDTSIVRPGIETNPIFAQKHMLGKLIWQFKSFATASTSRIFLSGLQRRDATVVAALTMLVGMGMLQERARYQLSVLAGNTDIPEPSTEELLMAGFSRSGVLGLLGTTALDLGRIAKNPRSSMYTGKFALGQLFGPSIGQIQDLVDTSVKGLVNGYNTSVGKGITRMLPFYNLTYLRPLLDQAFFGDEKKNKRKRRRRRRNTSRRRD